MKKRSLLISFILASMVLTGCKPQTEELIEQRTDKAIADSVEMAITSIGSVGDEEEGEELSTSNLLSVQSAEIDTEEVCSGRAVESDCVNGLKVKNYNCNIGESDQTLVGYVSLDYSDITECSVDQEGESVVRTFEKTRTTSWGAEIRTTSVERSDFEGDTYGGGGKITTINGGYELEILGKHRIRTGSQGKSRLDISMKTSSPIFMNQLKRKDRLVDGGALEISHNLAKYKVTLEPNNLSYSEGCCYPTSGTIDVTFSGIISGIGTVNFNSCGNATVTRGNESHDIEFYSCE